MIFDLSTILIIAILLNVAFAALLLYFIVLVGNKKVTLEEQEEEITNKLYKDTKVKSFDILGGALKKADKIISNAELRGIKLFAKEKIDSTKIAEEYKSHIEALEQTLKDQFNNRIGETEKHYTEFITVLEKTLDEHLLQNQQLLTDKTTNFINLAEQSLNTSVTKTQEEVRNQLTQEMEGAKREIEEYKKKRLTIIDQNIVEILEKTLSIVLGKKLSLNDQSELIYKALEEAKKEHALA